MTDFTYILQATIHLVEFFVQDVDLATFVWGHKTAADCMPRPVLLHLQLVCAIVTAPK
ncbi:MAG: hypothetical protein NVSMB33_01800 [Ktedonobacteraceae bacterium]